MQIYKIHQVNTRYMSKSMGAGNEVIYGRKSRKGESHFKLLQQNVL